MRFLGELWEDDADSIYRRGMSAFEETEAQAIAVAARMQPGKHWTEVYETLKDDHPPADGLKQAIKDIAALRKEYYSNVKVAGASEDLNKNLEMAGRVADFLELGELMCLDALERDAFEREKGDHRGLRPADARRSRSVAPATEGASRLGQSADSCFRPDDRATALAARRCIQLPPQ